MLTYNIQFEKSEVWQQNPATLRWGFVMVPVYTMEQFGGLEQALQEGLGEAFELFEVLDQPGQQMTRLTYHGILEGEVETHRYDQIEGIYNTWIAAQVGG